MSRARTRSIALASPATVYAASTSGWRSTASRTSAAAIRPSHESATNACVDQPKRPGSTAAV